MKYATAPRLWTLVALALLAGCQSTTLKSGQPISGVYNIRSYGATGDGVTLDTPAINKAIDAASAGGGGTVLFPAGTYRSVSIHLKSNITLYLDQGATLLAATINDTDRYDLAEPNPNDKYQDFGHSHFHNSLIWGENVENVAILGPGRIWGEGLSRGTGQVPGLPPPKPATRPTTRQLIQPADGTLADEVASGRRRRRGATTQPALLPETFTEYGYTGAQPAAGDGADADVLPPHTGRLALRALAATRAATRNAADPNFRAPPASRPANPTYPSAMDSLPQGAGNKSICLVNSRNVTLRDFSILHGGHFGILVTDVQNLTIDNLKIDTNRDGMDIDSCSNVRVSNCSVNSPYDDAIVLKSDFSLGRFIPMENCSITNCFVSGGFVEGALLDGTFARSGPDARVGRTGRIKLGTESSGGFKNIAISNCVFDNCGGLALESVDGATLEDVTISNITMRDIINMPIFIRLGGRDRAPVDEPGAVRHINISDIVCHNTSGDYASVIVGIPGYPVEDVKISNVRIITEGGGDLYDAATRPAELVPNYPEPSMFGVIPSYGFYIRHVDGIELNNIQISCTQPDQRPAFALIDVKNADFNHIKAPLMAGTPMFVLDEVDNFTSKFVPGIQDVMLEHVDKKAF
jgi:polygalacturonase